MVYSIQRRQNETPLSVQDKQNAHSENQRNNQRLYIFHSTEAEMYVGNLAMRFRFGENYFQILRISYTRQFKMLQIYGGPEEDYIVIPQRCEILRKI